MRGMVLAAGLGTRLRPATNVVPKPLFPVLGLPAIDWVLAGMARAGVDRCVVNLHHLPEAVVAHLGRSRFGVALEYSLEPEILGTGGGMAAVRGFLDDGAPFLLHNGDVFTDWDLAAAVRRHRDAGAEATMLLADPPDLPNARLVEVADGRVVGIRGRPAAGDGPRYVFSGVSVLGPGIFRHLPPAGASCLVEKGLIPWMAAGTAVRGDLPGGLFCDIGTAERFLALQWELFDRAEALFASRGLEPPAALMPGVLARGAPRLEPGCEIVPPVLLGDGAVVAAGASIGPRVVLCDGAVAAPGSDVQDAVLLPGAVGQGEVRGVVVP